MFMSVKKNKQKTNLIIFVHGQTNEITEQIVDLVLKQTDVRERLACQIHELVRVNYLTFRNHQDPKLISMTVPDSESCVIYYLTPFSAIATYPSFFAPTGAGSPEQTRGCPGADAIIAKMEERAVKGVTLLVSFPYATFFCYYGE